MIVHNSASEEMFVLVVIHDSRSKLAIMPRVAIAFGLARISAALSQN
jgi:hypothetical protein